MIPQAFRKDRQSEISTSKSNSYKFSEKSPLFRDYGPREVKQSPVFADNASSKYGSSLKLKDIDAITPTRKRFSFARPSLTLPATNYGEGMQDTRDISSKEGEFGLELGLEWLRLESSDQREQAIS
jgi:hypothetical protein